MEVADADGSEEFFNRGIEVVRVKSGERLAQSTIAFVFYSPVFLSCHKPFPKLPTKGKSVVFQVRSSRLHSWLPVLPSSGRGARVLRRPIARGGFASLVPPTAKRDLP